MWNPMVVIWWEGGDEGLERDDNDKDKTSALGNKKMGEDLDCHEPGGSAWFG
jgi:hypothetical protein